MKKRTQRIRPRNATMRPGGPRPSLSGTSAAAVLPQAPSHRQVVKPREACQRIQRSRSSLWRDVRAGTFPSPIKLSNSGSIGFFADEIDAWLESRPRVRPSKEPA